MSEEKAKYANKFLGELNNSEITVIKIGSALLVDPANGTLRREWIQDLATQIKERMSANRKFVLVSSGAVGVGKSFLGIDFKTPIPLDVKQATAATGNPILMHEYATAFAEYDLKVAQVLVTPACTQEPRRRLNLQDTINRLLNMGIIPIINENDTVATMEIRYGDNDRLSALIAGVIGANWLILLSDVDGLYEEDPKKNPAAKFREVIEQLTSEIMGFGKDAGTSVSTGGMRTKLLAAQIAMENYGCNMLIADGTEKCPIEDLEGNTARASWFKAHRSPSDARRRNIIKQGVNREDAMIIVSENAISHFEIDGIRPRDVLEVIGEFDRGETVQLHTLHSFFNQSPKALVITEHSNRDVKKIMGLQEEEGITAALGYFGRFLIAHPKNLQIIG